MFCVVPRMVGVRDVLEKPDEYVLLDVRRRVEYISGHIPHAKHCSFSNFIRLVGVALYPEEADKISKVLSRLGVEEDSFIVFYDNFYGRHAARAAYTFELLGFKNIGLLESTYDQYVSKGYPVSREESHPKTLSNLVLNYDQSLVVDRLKVEKAATSIDGKTIIVDTRNRVDYEFGHIPRAINIPWDLFMGRNMIFDVEAVRKISGEKKLHEADEIILYCEEGTSSSLAMYAFRVGGLLNSHTYLPSYPDWVGAFKPVVKKTVESF